MCVYLFRFNVLFSSHMSSGSSVILLFLRSLLSNTLSAVSNSAAFACLSYTSGISSSKFNGGSHSPPISAKKSVLIGFPFSFSKLNFALSLITFCTLFIFAFIRVMARPRSLGPTCLHLDMSSLTVS